MRHMPRGVAGAHGGAIGAFSCDSEHFSWWFGLTHEGYGREFFKDYRQDSGSEVIKAKEAPDVGGGGGRVPSSGAIDCVFCTQSTSLAHEDDADNTASV